MFLNSIDVKNVSLTYATKASLIKYIYLQFFCHGAFKNFPLFFPLSLSTLTFTCLMEKVDTTKQLWIEKPRTDNF